MLKPLVVVLVATGVVGGGAYAGIQAQQDDAPRSQSSPQQPLNGGPSDAGFDEPVQETSPPDVSFDGPTDQDLDSNYGGSETDEGYDSGGNGDYGYDNNGLDDYDTSNDFGLDDYDTGLDRGIPISGDRCAESLSEWALSGYLSPSAELYIDLYCDAPGEAFTGGSDYPISRDRCAEALAEYAESNFLSPSAELYIDLYC